MSDATVSDAIPPLVDSVDIHRYQGDWYVHGNIPTFPEKNAYNSVEKYEVGKDGKTMETTFTFQNGGFDKSVSGAVST